MEKEDYTATSSHILLPFKHLLSTYRLICFEVEASVCASLFIGIHWEEQLIWNLDAHLSPGSVCGGGRGGVVSACRVLGLDLNQLYFNTSIKYYSVHIK